VTYLYTILHLKIITELQYTAIHNTTVAHSAYHWNHIDECHNNSRRHSCCCGCCYCYFFLLMFNWQKLNSSNCWSGTSQTGWPSCYSPNKLRKGQWTVPWHKHS